MSKIDTDRTQQGIATSRRGLLGMAGGAALAGAGAGALTLPWIANAQDNPVNCTPIGAAGKKPVPFKPNTDLPVRVRKSAFELSAAEVNRLKAAYAALRKLTQTSPSDPRGWLRQGYVHCWYCGGGSNDQEGEAIHFSWWFFPWHRAYLYFHERILCKLIKDDTLALPYWDWDTQTRQTFPSIYGDPNDKSNPLYDMLRSAKPGNAISTTAVSKSIMNKAMNAPNNNLFMGTQTGTAGAVENQPHGPVHVWTGDVTMQNSNNDMGILATAAQDPVFFSHHANIDRLWNVWLGLASTHKNFTSPTWTTHPWQFYDENSVWTQIQVSDVLNAEASLRYTWQQPSKPPIWTFTQHKVPLAATAPTAAAAPEEPPLLVANAPSGMALGTAPLTQSVAVPADRMQRFAALQADSPPQYTLHIEGIQTPPNAQVMFNVYLNLPDANAKTGDDVPNFVGLVTVLAKSKEMMTHNHAAANAAFDITDVLGKVTKADSTNLSVTLVPTAAGVAPEKASGTTFKRIYIQRE